MNQARTVPARAFITGTGVYLPPDRISNDELVASFNAYVASRADEPDDPTRPILEPSNSTFIEDASGIKYRHVLEKTGILDPARMVPNLPERLDDALSIQAEFAVRSARLAIADAGLEPHEIDLVICSCAHHQRPYPAIAIEVQKALGCAGAAFDMNVACSSTTFAMHLAQHMVRAGAARNVLVSSPEIMSGHLNYRDRKTHFIFGDASASIVISAEPKDGGEHGVIAYEVLDTEIWTEFSNNIRSNFGFLNRTAPETAHTDDKLVTQIGNKVFKDIIFAASRFIREFLAKSAIEVADLERLWLHQANLKMIRAITRHLAGDELITKVPIVLGEIGNVASPGSLVAFHETKAEPAIGGHGLICSFGAGYSIGALLVRRVS